MSRAQPKPWFRKSRDTYYITINGVQKNLNTSDKKEAYRRWHQLMGGEGDNFGSAAASVVELLAKFADWSQRHKSPSTYIWYRHFLQSFLRSVPADLDVGELKPYHVTHWLDSNPQWGKRSTRCHQIAQTGISMGGRRRIHLSFSSSPNPQTARQPASDDPHRGTSSNNSRRSH